jgi:hypothetical protein
MVANTLCPARARTTAVANPIPLLEPVTKIDAIIFPPAAAAVCLWFFSAGLSALRIVSFENMWVLQKHLIKLIKMLPDNSYMMQKLTCIQNSEFDPRSRIANYCVTLGRYGNRRNF